MEVFGIKAACCTKLPHVWKLYDLQLQIADLQDFLKHAFRACSRCRGGLGSGLSSGCFVPTLFALLGVTDAGLLVTQSMQVRSQDGMHIQTPPRSPRDLFQKLSTRIMYGAYTDVGDSLKGRFDEAEIAAKFGL